MTQEDKELLLQDLCARLPYGVKAESVYINPDTKERKSHGIEVFDATDILLIRDGFGEFKPYLFPLSSMTDKQKVEYNSLRDLVPTEQQCEIGNLLGDFEFVDNWRSIDYLNANYFDYRGLIEKGLAIDATGTDIYDVPEELL